MNPRPLPRQGSALPLSYVPVIRAFTKYQDGSSLSRTISPANDQELYGIAVIYSQLANNVGVNFSRSLRSAQSRKRVPSFFALASLRSVPTSVSPERTAARTTHHPYLFKDPNKLQLAHDLHSLAKRKWPGLDPYIISIVLSDFPSWQDMFSLHLESFNPAF